MREIPTTDSILRFLFYPIAVLCIAFLAWVLVIAHGYALLGAALAFIALRTAYILLRSRLPAVPGAGALAGRIAGAVCAVRLAWIVALGFVIRFAWALATRPIPSSDFATYYRFALNLSRGDLHVLGAAKSPITLLYYAGVFKLLGHALVFLYLANSALGALQIYLVYLISRDLFRSETSARASALLAALFPSVILFTGIASSEMPFTALLLLIVFAAGRLARRGATMSLPRIAASGSMLGALIAALHLTRNLGVIIGVWLVVAILLFAAMDRRRNLLLCGTAVLAALAVLSPQVRYNYKTNHVISINSSPFSSLNLLMGTNRVTKGTFNVADRRLVTRKFKFRGETYKSASRYARRMAFERIAEDPRGFVRFALTGKFREMWGRDWYGAMFPSSIKTRIVQTQLTKSGRRVRRNYAVLPGKQELIETANRYYFFVIALTMCAMALGLREKRIDRAVFVMVAGVVLLAALLHIFVEVQARYHFYVLFLFAVLAGGIVGGSGTTEHDADGPAVLQRDLTVGQS